jgi:hypothetical protein
MAANLIQYNIPVFLKLTFFLKTCGNWFYQNGRGFTLQLALSRYTATPAGEVAASDFSLRRLPT